MTIIKKCYLKNGELDVAAMKTIFLQLVVQEVNDFPNKAFMDKIMTYIHINKNTCYAIQSDGII